VTTELDAAKAAGCRTLLCVRPGNRPQRQHAYRVVHSFDEVTV
jgi:methionine salvage enolase-phosphatase E1